MLKKKVLNIFKKYYSNTCTKIYYSYTSYRRVYECYLKVFGKVVKYLF